MSRDASHWRWLGWPLALVLALAALAVTFLFNPRLEAELLLQQSAAKEARARFLNLQQGLRKVPVSVEPVEDFRAALPQAQARGQRVADLLALASRQGLSVPRSEYRLATERALGLVAYRVQLPVVGRYSQVRSFIQAALAQDPALSLDVLRLRRAQAGMADVRADLQFSLWMNAGADLGLMPAADRP